MSPRATGPRGGKRCGQGVSRGTPAPPPAAPALPAEATATVVRSAGGPEVQVSGVPVEDVPAVMEWLDALFRSRRIAPPGPDTVPGGTPVDVREDYWAEEGRGIGFRPDPAAGAG